MFSNSMLAYTLSGFIICIKIKFHITAPIPNATTKTDVTLFLELGKCAHMQFRSGIELIENMHPGIISENTVKV